MRQLTKPMAKPKKPHDLQYLLKHSPVGWVKYAKDTRVLKARIVKLKTGGIRLEAIAMKRVKGARQHHLYIESTGDAVSQGPVKVSCDCNSFLFTFEAALHHHGNADIIHSNGAYPHYTNPMLIPGMCSHLVCVSLYAISRGL